MDVPLIWKELARVTYLGSSRSGLSHQSDQNRVSTTYLDVCKGSRFWHWGKKLLAFICTCFNCNTTYNRSVHVQGQGHLAPGKRISCLYLHLLSLQHNQQPLCACARAVEADARQRGSMILSALALSATLPTTALGMCKG
eukprot:632612-Pelagomonas_calceolata.AAC.1